MTGDNSWRRLRRVFRRDPAKEIGSELDHHVEERVRDYITRGMSPEEARRSSAWATSMPCVRNASSWWPLNAATRNDGFI
jgi:hypothetical protein